MSALDLFAMLNAPLSGTGAGASMFGQPDGQESGAFAGLLAMLSPKAGGEGAAETAPTSASAGMALAPFRFNGAGAFVPSDDVSPDGPESDTGEEAGEDVEAAVEDVVQAGLIAATSTPTPQAATAPSVGGASAPSVPVPPSPPTSSEADPAGAPVPPSDAETPPTSGQPQAASGSTEANAGFPLPFAQGDRTVQASQTAQTAKTAAASQSVAIPDPSGTTAAPDVPPETAQSTATADARVATEAARAVTPQTAATVVAPEASRLAPPPRPDPAQTERRGERRDGEGRTTLFATPESGDASRPSVAAPTQTNAAVAAAPPPAPRPAGGPGEIRVEPAPVAADPAAPEGEAAPESVRAADSQGAAPVREHLPSALSRASAETTAMLSAQIVRRLEARSTRFDMVLTPEDLGRVDVRMEVDSDGQLTARLAFDNPAAAAELRGRADELRRQLEAAGFQMSDSALEFAERDGGRRDQPFDQRGRAFAGAGQLADAADTLSAPPRWTTLSLTPEGVDMKV